MKTKQVHLNIPISHFQNVLSWDQTTIDKLLKEAVNLAVKIGLRLDEDCEGIYLTEAESKGAKIDWNSQAVMFTHSQIEKTIAILCKTSPAPDPLRPLSICEKEGGFTVGNGANLLFDWDTWQVKAPTTEDFVQICQWAQGCEDISILHSPVLLKDIDQRLAPIYSYALMAKHCRKPVLHEHPTEPIHVKYMNKMALVHKKRRDYYQPMQIYEFINPPFRLGQRSIKTMLARIDSGICDSMGIGTMAVAGMSAPVTIAGLAVTALAEILAGLTFFNILRPGHSLKANSSTGCLDMRTACVSFANMQTHIGNLATWELLVRGIGTDGTSLDYYRDANEPGLQAMYEFGMYQAFFSSVSRRIQPEFGSLACSAVFSPHQAMLDLEMAGEFNELIRSFKVCDEILGLDEVINARFEQGVHMGTKHTLNHMTDSISLSKFFFRGLPGGARHDKNHTQTDILMKKTAESVQAAIEAGRKQETDEELGNEMYEYVKEAAAELNIDVPLLV